MIKFANTCFLDPPPPRSSCCYEVSQIYKRHLSIVYILLFLPIGKYLLMMFFLSVLINTQDLKSNYQIRIIKRSCNLAYSSNFFCLSQISNLFSPYFYFYFKDSPYFLKIDGIIRTILKLVETILICSVLIFFK